MDPHAVRQWLVWCTRLNCGLLRLWWRLLLAARPRPYRFRRRRARLSDEPFDPRMFSRQAYDKLGVLLFNAVPCLALDLSG